MRQGGGALRAVYGLGALLVGGLTFFGSWAYAVSQYGFFLGGGLGWIPAVFIGIIVGAIWPIGALGMLWLWADSTQSRREYDQYRAREDSVALSEWFDTATVPDPAVRAAVLWERKHEQGMTPERATEYVDSVVGGDWWHGRGPSTDTVEP